MDEILSRGRKNSGEWVEGFYIKSDWFNIIVSLDDINSLYNVEPKTVSRFTGLTDKNGRRVFEGDVVKTKYGRICKVVWFSSKSYCGWDLQAIGDVENPPPDTYDMWKPENLEIIGNIYDNPIYDIPELAESESTATVKVKIVKLCPDCVRKRKNDRENDDYGKG